VPNSTDEWETGNWHLFPAEIKKIYKGEGEDNGNVCLHLNKKAGCHFGGQILDVRAAGWGKNRVIIKFRLDPCLAETFGENWGQEIAFVPRIQKAP
jgi:hypothetical protein